MSAVGQRAVSLTILDDYTNRSVDQRLTRGRDFERRWRLDRSAGWYDLTITVDGDATFRYQMAGHVEDRRDSTSDPLMGGLV